MQTASGGDNQRVIKARLTSGEIVELVKDCDCHEDLHIGPHWLHMNDFDRSQNEQMLCDARADNNRVLYRHAALMEIARLNEKGAYLMRLNIAEIIRPDAAGATT